MTPIPSMEKPAPQKRRLPVQEILRGQQEVVIVHAGGEYRLRVTKNGKLILTK